MGKVNITRRKALSTAGKVITGVVVSGVIAGVGGYLAGASTVQAPIERTVTKTETVGMATTTLTQMSTITVKERETVTVTAGAPGKPLPKLTLAAWTYRPDIVESNLKFFSTYYGYPTELMVLPTAGYTAQMVANFTGEKEIDVCYVRDGEFVGWASAGWLVPIEDVAPSDKIKMYKEEISPGALEAMTFEGKLYGLPYYGDVMGFLYNHGMLEKVGFSNPPEDWDDVTEICLAVKRNLGIETPFWFSGGAADWGITRLWQTMTFSRGGSLFNEDLEPTWEDKGSPAYEAMKWLWDAINTHGIASVKGFEVTHEQCSEALAGDPPKGFCEIVHSYNLFLLNTPGNFPRSGLENFKQCLMPGKTHQTVSYCRLYGITMMAKKRGADVLNGAWELVEFLGGKDKVGEYRVMKRWILESGLGFVQLPLYEDPVVKANLSKWADPDLKLQQLKLSRRESGLGQPGYAEWLQFTTSELQAAMLKQKSLDEALKNSADKWRALK
ncbi:MAG: extracellular solute-binding protein [Nitrososphaerota archaeon]